MSSVIFCKTRYQDIGYASYNDLWNMVTWAGYETIYVDELDPQSDNTYIFTPANAETINGWPDAKAQIILWQLEWMLTDEHNTPPGVKRTWAMDKWMADSHGYEYVPIGSDDRLNELGTQYPAQKRYDVAILSYQTHRRQAITAQLENEGLRLAPISGIWGRLRSDVLLSSYAMVHTHQNENMAGIASLRWAIAAAHSLPVITETVNERGIFGYGCMVQSDYDFLAKFTYHMLQDKQRLADYGNALHDLLCVENTFRKVIEANV